MSKIADNKIANYSAYLATATTLSVSPWSNFDPINLVKLLLLSSGSFAILSLALWRNEKLVSIVSSRHLQYSLMFPIFLLSAFLFSGSSFSQQFWGVFGRNNGLLSYLSLYFLFFAIATNTSRNLSAIITTALKFTNVIILFYSLIQWSGNDPINWSQKSMFATLGNVNFASAFLAISAVGWMVSLLYKELQISSIAILTLIVVELVVLMKMDSIQGPLIFISTFLILAFLRLREVFRSRIFVLATSIIATVSVAMTTLGVLGIGPLKRFVFQNSNVFRADYMGAALRMIRDNPMFGVGLDSYDNWYRNYRGFITSYRTGLNRTSNSAHNIFLDIGAGGGAPLLLGYLAIIVLAAMAFFRIIKNSQVVNPKLLVIAFAWFAYQIQSLVSINQIGVGVWGWLLSGALIAVASHTQSFDTSDRTSSKLTKVKKVKSEETLSPDRLLVGIFVGIIGMVFALPPVVADAQFRKDFTSGNLQNLKMSDEEMGLSNFHLEKALETLVARGLNIEATDLASRIIGKYPRSIYAWQILAAKTQNSEVRQKAIENLRRLDPWNACFETDSAGRIQNWFSEISTAQKLELLRWWGLLPMSSKTEADQKLLSSVPASDLQTRFEGFCR